MLTQFLSIGILLLLTAMLPGPDFAIVTKNTLVYSRRAGIFTSLGISCACMVHVTYCMLGLAIVISESVWLFNIIKYIGAVYLIYLGITSFITKQLERSPGSSHPSPQKSALPDIRAFRQGFLTNLLNPKATLFFLALFTVIIKPGTIGAWGIGIAIEMFIIILGWFCCLTLILSHPRVLRTLNKIEHYIAKVLGVFLVGFGVVLAFAKR
jgi:RhtB (resistance to homoserine/threonine) family protein